MAIARQVELRRGAVTLALNTTPYALMAGAWASSGPALELRVIIQSSTLAEMDRYTAELQRWVGLAEQFESALYGAPVYVYTKTCDTLTTVAEFGATWLRKRIRGGVVLVPDVSESAAGQYSAVVTLSLQVEDTWQRAAPESLLLATGSGAPRTDGGMILTAGSSLTARRITWTAATGLTVRVRWLYSDNDCQFFFAETGANDMKALYSAADNKLYIYDDAGNSAASSALTAAAGDELDLVFKWDPTTPKMGIWVNGVANGSDAHGTLDAADTYVIFAPSTVSQNLLSWQLWPTALTDAQCAGLNAGGRPEPELAFYVAPADAKNTNAAYKIYNVPGDASARLRLLLSDATQAYDQFKVGFRPIRPSTPTACLWECESGTNGTDVADAADATASGGNVALFTPTATTWVTRVTLVLAADPDDVAALYGQHRLYLACKDSAASQNTNLFQWRLVVAGQAGAWSESLACAAVATYSLVDCGIVDLPPGDWPDEMEACTTDVHAGSYVTLEIQSANSIGNTGGTFAFDAVYLAPAEREGTVLNSTLTTAQFVLLDWTGGRPSAVVVADAASLEFAGWADYTGDEFLMPAIAGDAGLLWIYGLRDVSEAAQANDTVAVRLYVRPTFRR